jgi:inner membrane protein YidH
MSKSPDQETIGRRLVYFAAERTLMAWIRTALGLMALGFVIDRFGLVLRQVLPQAGPLLHPQAFSFWAGTVMVLIGAGMAATAAVRYLRFALSYQRHGGTDPRNGVLVGVFFAVSVALVGLVIAWFLMTATV